MNLHLPYILPCQMLFVPDKYYTSQTHKYSKHSRCKSCNQEANDKEQYCQLSIGFSASPAHACRKTSACSIMLCSIITTYFFQQLSEPRRITPAFKRHKKPSSWLVQQVFCFIDFSCDIWWTTCNKRTKNIITRDLTHAENEASIKNIKTQCYQLCNIIWQGQTIVVWQYTLNKIQKII